MTKNSIYPEYEFMEAPEGSYFLFPNGDIFEVHTLIFDSVKCKLWVQKQYPIFAAFANKRRLRVIKGGKYNE